MAMTNTPGAVIKYIGTASSYTDPVAGTGTWVSGETRTVDDDIGQLLASNTYNFQKVSDIGSPYVEIDTVTGGISIFDMVVVDGLVVGNGSSSSSNTALIQAALNTKGRIFVDKPGVVFINDTLVISSNTELVISPECVLTQAPNVNKAMLINAAQNASPTVVTLAWSSGDMATVTWVNHQRTADDYVCIQGASSGEFNNVFRIHKVVSEDSFTVRLYRTPSASPTGTITARVCDKNIHIKGGIFDYDTNNNAAAAQGINRHAIVLGYIARSSATRYQARNVLKYGFCTFASADCAFDGISGFNVAEIFKTYGPCVNQHLRGLYGQAVDDCATIQAREPAAFIAYQPAQGDIINVTVEDVNVTNVTGGAAALVVYASDTDIIDGIRYKNISCHSDAGNGLSLKYGNTFSTGTLGSIYIEGINATGKSTTNYPINVGCNVDCLHITTATPVPADLTTQLLRQENTSRIRELTIEGLRFVNSNWPSSQSYIVNLNGAVDVCNFRGGYISINSAQGRLLNIGTGNVYTVNIDGMDIETANALIMVAAGASVTRHINLRGNRIKSVTNGVECRSLASITLTGNVFDTISGGVVRPATTTGLMAKVFSGGGNEFTSAPVITCLNSATVEVYGLDLQVDVGATGFQKTTSGQYCYNNGAARGTLVQNRLVTCNGTNWVQVDNPALLF